MRPKSLILLMLALGCGLMASIGISQVMDRRNQQPQAAGETKPIFIALKEIGFGEPLNMQVLKLEEWPVHLIPPGSLSRLEDVEGQLAGARFVPGEPILEAKLMGKGDSVGPAVAIPKGFRVVSVHVDAVSSIGSLIKPADRVDVLVYVNRNPASGITESGTKTILQDVKVFAVNEQWRRPEEAAEGSIAAKTISLLVTPEQAEKVTLATEMGKIRLVLRSPDDDVDIGADDGTVASDIFASATEKTDREAEKAPGNSSGPDAGFLSWLSQQSQVAPSTGSLPQTSTAETLPPDNFVMELLEGSALRTVEFHKEPSSSSRWQNGSQAVPQVPQSSTPAQPLGLHDEPAPESLPDAGDHVTSE